MALAVGFEGTPSELALACQRAEQRASGVPCGVMDQLASAAGVEGHALLIDCACTATTPVALTGDLAIVVVDSGQRRSLAEGTAYADRRAACERAAARIGPLRRCLAGRRRRHPRCRRAATGPPRRDRRGPGARDGGRLRAA